MSKQQFIETLRSIKGKPFIIGGKQHLISDFSVNEHLRRVTVRTDRRSFDKSFLDIPEFLESLEPVPQTDTEPQPDTAHEETSHTEPQQAVIVAEPEANEVDVYQEHSNLAKDLIDILRENINKVRTSKDYIPQAQAINNNVNSIINVTKLQLDVYKQFKGKSKQ